MNQLNKRTREELIAKLQRYFEDELQQDLGQFEGEFLLDFLAEHLGPHFYNQGLEDAASAVRQRTEFIVEAIEELELLA